MSKEIWISAETLTSCAHGRATKEKVSMRGAFCRGDTFTIINPVSSQDTFMEIIFISQAFWRLYVFLIHVQTGLRLKCLTRAKIRALLCPAMPSSYKQPHISPFDCWPCQVQRSHGWRSLLSLGQSLCSRPCTRGQPQSRWKVPAWAMAMNHGSHMCCIGLK